MKGVQLANSAKTSDVNTKYILLILPRGTQNQKKTMAASLVMVCSSVMGPRVPSPCAVLLPFFHGRLIALAQSARSFAPALVATPFQSVPLLPRPEKQNTPRTCGSNLKIDNYRAG